MGWGWGIGGPPMAPNTDTFKPKHVKVSVRQNRRKRRYCTHRVGDSPSLLRYDPTPWLPGMEETRESLCKRVHSENLSKVVNKPIGSWRHIETRLTRGGVHRNQVRNQLIVTTMKSRGETQGGILKKGRYERRLKGRNHVGKECVEDRLFEEVRNIRKNTANEEVENFHRATILSRSGSVLSGSPRPEPRT